jgi:hypothetical protein
VDKVADFLYDASNLVSEGSWQLPESEELQEREMAQVRDLQI